MGQPMHRYENLLNREFHANRPNFRWVTDISSIIYFKTRELLWQRYGGKLLLYSQDRVYLPPQASNSGRGQNEVQRLRAESAYLKKLASPGFEGRAKSAQKTLRIRGMGQSYSLDLLSQTAHPAKMQWILPNGICYNGASKTGIVVPHLFLRRIVRRMDYGIGCRTRRL